MLSFINTQNFLANAITGEQSAETSGVQTGFWHVLEMVVTFIWSRFMTFVHFIVKFALNICDLLQYFIQKLIGIDFWNSDASFDEIGESDILFRFLMNESVVKVFRALIVVGLILIIMFSIAAIVRSDYATATSGELKSKKQVLVASLKSIFLIILVPLMLLFGILASNAILASILNAINANSSNITLGGQVFTASSFSANKYRMYADSGYRQAASYTYTFAYNDYSDSASGSIIIVPIGADYYVTYSILEQDEKELANDSEWDIHPLSGSSYSNVINSERTKFYEFNALFEPINPKDYKENNPLFAFVYYFDGEQSSTTSYTTTYYLAKFNNPTADNYIDKVAKLYYLDDVLDARVVRSDLNSYDSWVNSLFRVSSLTNKGDLGGENYTLGGSGESVLRTKVNSSGLIFNDVAGASALPDIAYNTWNFAKRFDGYSYVFDETISIEETTWQKYDDAGNPSGEAENGYRIVKNVVNTFGRFDGGNVVGLSPIREEYEVMADLIDFLVETGFKVTIVNSQSPLIDWSNVSTDNYTYNPTTKLYELCVNYANVGKILYKPTNANSETQGAIYLVCQEINGRYYPIIPGEEIEQAGLNAEAFKSEYYGSSYGYGQGLVIARGVFDDATNYLEPTYIAETFTDANGNDVSVSSPKYVVVTKPISNQYAVTSQNTVTLIQAAGQLSDYVNLGSLSNIIDDSSAEHNIVAGYEAYKFNNTSILANQTVFGGVVGQYSLFKSVVPTNTYGLGNRLSVADAGVGVIVAIYDYSQSSSNLKITLSYGGTISGDVYATAQVKVGDEVVTGERARSIIELCTNCYCYLNQSKFACDGESTFAVGVDNTNLMLSKDLFDQLLKSGSATASISQTLTRVVFDVLAGDIVKARVTLKPNLITVVNYQRVSLNGGNDISTSNLTDVIGISASGSEAYVKYRGQQYVLDYFADNQTGIKIFYLNDESEKTCTLSTYTFDFYDAFSYKTSLESSIYTMRTPARRDASGGAGRIFSNVNYASLTASLSSSANVANKLFSKSISLFVNDGVIQDIRDIEGNRLYSVSYSRSLSNMNNFNVYFYVDGQVALRIIAQYTGAGTAQQPSIITLFNAIDAGGTADNWLIKGFEYVPYSVDAVPVYDSDVLGDVEVSLLKPSKIVFRQQDIETSIASIDINLDLFILRLHPKLFGGSIHTVSTADVTSRPYGEFVLDYNFNMKSGIGLNFLYSPAHINPIILVFATIVLFHVLITSVWGLIKRIYDITILFLVMPGFAATIPLDDGLRFKKWQEKIVSSVFSAYGVLIGINLFFVLVPLIDSATSNIFTYSDLPSTVKNSFASVAMASGLTRIGGSQIMAVSVGSIFGSISVAYLNKLVSLMFTLVAITLMKTLPKYLSKLLQFGNAYKDGGDTQQAVTQTLNEVGDTVSGKKAHDFVQKNLPSRDKDGNIHPGMLGRFIPGSALAGSAIGAISRFGQKLRPHGSMFGGLPTSGSAGSTGGEGGTPSGSTGRTSGSADGPSGTGGGTSTTVYPGSGGTGGLPNNDPMEVKGNTENNPFSGKVDLTPDKTGKELFDQQVNNAMADNDKYGEFVTSGHRDDIARNLNSQLGSDYQAMISDTGTKDANGQSIWAVKVGKIGGDVSALNEKIDGADNAKKEWQGKIDEIDADNRRLSGDRDSAIKAGIGLRNDYQQADKALSSVIKPEHMAEFHSLTQDNATYNKEIAKLDEDWKAADDGHKETEKRFKTERYTLSQFSKFKNDGTLGPDNKKTEEEFKQKGWIKDGQITKEGYAAWDALKTAHAQTDNEKRGWIAEKESISAEQSKKQKFVDQNNARIAEIANGESAQTVNGLIKNRDIAKAAYEANQSKIGKIEKQIGDNGVRKSRAEAVISKLDTQIQNRSTERDNRMGARYKSTSEKATNDYENAVTKQTQLDGLTKVMRASNIPQKTKDAAIKKYVDSHYSEKERDAKFNELKTTEGFSKEKEKTHKEVISKRAIANGANFLANKYNGTHESNPINSDGYTKAQVEGMKNAVEIKPQKPTIKQRVRAAGDSVRARVENAGATVGRTVRKVGTGVKSTASKIGSSVGETSGKIGAKIGRTVHKVGIGIKTTAGKVGSTVGKVSGKAGSAIGRTIARVGGTAKPTTASRAKPVKNGSKARPVGKPTTKPMQNGSNARPAVKPTTAKAPTSQPKRPVTGYDVYDAYYKRAGDKGDVNTAIAVANKQVELNRRIDKVVAEKASEAFQAKLDQDRIVAEKIRQMSGTRAYKQNNNIVYDDPDVKMAMAKAEQLEREREYLDGQYRANETKRELNMITGYNLSDEEISGEVKNRNSSNHNPK